MARLSSTGRLNVVPQVLLLLLFVVSLAAPLYSQPASQSRESDPLTRRIEAAGTLQPELKADAWIKIASAGLPRKRATELLVGAFRAARSAKYDVAMFATLPAARRADSSLGNWTTALSAGLDRLSLQSRAVSTLASIDSKLASEMFLQIAMPSLARRSANDPLVPSFRYWHAGASAVLRTEITPEEKERVLQWIMAATVSPTQFEGTLSLLRTLPLTDDDRLRYIIQLAGAMAASRADPRTAAAALSFGLNQQVFDTMKVLPAGGAITLLSGYRKFLGSNSSIACNDDEQFVLRILQLKQFVLGAMSESQTDFPELRLDPPNRVDCQISAGLSLSAGKATEVLKEIQSLQEVSKTPPIQERGEVFDRVTAQFKSWLTNNDESPEELFAQVTSGYLVLIELAPGKDRRASLLADYGRYLAASPMYALDPPLWALAVRRLFLMDGRGKWLQPLRAALAQSGPVLVLYDLEYPQNDGGLQ